MAEILNHRREELNDVNFIKSVMSILGLDQKGLAAKIPKSQASVSLWVSGARSIPKPIRFKLESFLKPVKKPTPLPEIAPKNDRYIMVPILSDFPEANSDQKIDTSNKIDEVRFPTWMIDATDQDNCYIVKVTGPKGVPEHIVIKRKKVYKKGDVCVVKIDGKYNFKKIDEHHTKIEIRGVLIKYMKDII